MSINALASFAANSRAETERQAGAVALHTADTLAVLAGALGAREPAAVARFFRGGDRAANVAGLAAAIRSSECDDIHVPSCMTAGSIAVPLALEFAQDEASYTAAVQAAYATGIALCEAVGGVEALAHGVWPSILAAPAVAAVACSVALGCDERAIGNTLALALAGSSGRIGRPGGSPSGRWLLYAQAVCKGIRAALAAREGFCGDTGLVSDTWLLQQTAADLARPGALQAPIVNPVGRVGLKPFVAARQGSNSIQAFVTLLDRGLDPGGIERVDVTLPPVALLVVSRPLDPENRLSTIAHLGLQFGIAAFERDRLLDIARECPFDARSLALAQKVNLAADPDLAKGPEGTWRARVRVRTGTAEVEEECDLLRGDPLDGGQAGLVRDKAARFCGAAGLPDTLETFADQRRLYAKLKVDNGQAHMRSTVSA